MNIQILEKIGEGTYGNVYKGIYNGGMCAIKEIKHENYYMKNLYWNNESMIFDKLSENCRHHVIKKLLHYSIDSNFYIVFEYINGPTVHTIIKKNSIKTRKKIGCSLLEDLIKGIAYIHCNNIYHLDIKDSNIMYDYIHFKYIDFGVSIMQGEHIPGITLKYRNTIYYGAPYTHPPLHDQSEKPSTEIMKV